MKRQNIEKKDLKFLSDILNPNGLIGSPILVGKLFYLLRQENPQFDHHSYGYKTFKDLLEAQSNINLSWRQLANGEKSLMVAWSRDSSTSHSQPVNEISTFPTETTQKVDNARNIGAFSTYPFDEGTSFKDFSLFDIEMKNVLLTLTDREMKVLELRFGIRWGMEYGGVKTLEEVGKDFGVTRERVRQI